MNCIVSVTHPRRRTELQCIFAASLLRRITIVNLLFSKARVAPIKQVTIPRLELVALVVGVRNIQFISSQIDIPLTRCFLWTDSKCSLHWIHSTKVLTVFVSNRVKEIRDSRFSCRYVPTATNPADIPSRGSSLTDLQSSNLWWHGPEFLALDEAHWPPNEFPDSLPQYEEVVPPAAPMLVRAVASATGIGELIDIRRFSSLTKLLRVTAWLLRFIDKLRGKKFNSTITSSELNFALSLWVRHTQHSSFAEVDFTRSAQFKHLNIFLDKDAILRCKGRLQFSSLPAQSKEPILLPKKHQFTFLVVHSFHKSLYHAGVRQTLAQVRQEYWIPHGRSLVQSVLHHCAVCRRVEGGPFKVPVSPALPSKRVSRDYPFATTGVDYFGPLFIRSDTKDRELTSKAWICLFTCAVTRAIHLEVVTDNSTDQFLLCLQRFSSLYGAPHTLISDNAKEFISASEILKTVFTADSVQDSCASVNIKWLFIPAVAPWMGGFYERMIGTVKRALRKVLGRKCLNLVQLQTIVLEVSAVVNSRPLVPYDHQAGELALTPSHFLGKAGRCGLPSVPVDLDPDPAVVDASRHNLIETWLKGQRILDEFWSSWHKEYLACLRERQIKNMNAHSSNSIPVAEGVVVLLKKPLVPRVQWKMGKITSLHHSDDGQVRSATVKLSNRRTVNRPIKLLFPIESSNAETPLEDLPPLEDRPVRKPRKAAITARKAILNQLVSSDSEEDH